MGFCDVSPAQPFHCCLPVYSAPHLILIFPYFLVGLSIALVLGQNDSQRIRSDRKLRAFL